jgi:hypothetical protein
MAMSKLQGLGATASGITVDVKDEASDFVTGTAIPVGGGYAING